MDQYIVDSEWPSWYEKAFSSPLISNAAKRAEPVCSTNFDCSDVTPVYVVGVSVTFSVSQSFHVVSDQLWLQWVFYHDITILAVRPRDGIKILAPGQVSRKKLISKTPWAQDRFRIKLPHIVLYQYELNEHKLSFSREVKCQGRRYRAVFAENEHVC